MQFGAFHLLQSIVVLGRGNFRTSAFFASIPVHVFVCEQVLDRIYLGCIVSKKKNQSIKIKNIQNSDLLQKKNTQSSIFHVTDI